MQPSDPLHPWLSELGCARASGAFANERTRPVEKDLPWNPASSRGTAGIGLRLVRRAVPVAAAAALALAVLIPGRMFQREDAAVPGTDSALTPLQAAGVNLDHRGADCNADGVVNGLDIDCFLRQHAASGGASALQTETFTRRLLGT